MAVLERKEVTIDSTWNLEPVFSSLEDWEKEFNDLEAALPNLQKFAGHLADSAQTLEDCLRTVLAVNRRAERLYVFAKCNSDVDTRDSGAFGTVQRVIGFFARLAAATSFLKPELLDIDEDTLNSYLETSSLSDLRRMIFDMVRFRPHTLSEGEERLLALGSEALGSAEKAFSQLSNADLTFGTIEVDGEKIDLTHSSYSVLLKNKNRSIRDTAFNQYYGVFNAHKNSFSALLTGSIQKDVFLAKAKKYPSAMERALFADNVSSDVYLNLIESVSKNLAPLHKYYSLRKEVLKLDEQRIFDTYVPLVKDKEVKHSYENACSLILKSLTPLGKEYCDILGSGLSSERWVDVYENKGKTSGAYSSGCYDTPPYILMNYKENDIRDVFTLTHEAGHSMHSYYSRRNQSYQDHDYTIFVAEVASTFNEQLLTRHLKERYKDDKEMLAFLINQEIDDLKATLYRQTMFAEFEKLTHEQLESNNPLTVDTYREIYNNLLEKYFGSAVTLAELDQLEYLRIPHFYWAFYVYKYSTGIAAAISLSEKVLAGDDQDLNSYLGFLKAGCSKYPLDVLRDAGVDMSSPKPIETACQRLGSLVDELSGLLL